MAIAMFAKIDLAPRAVTLSNGFALLVAILVAVVLVAGCKSAAVTGSWGNQVEPAGSGMDRDSSEGGGY